MTADFPSRAEPRPGAEPPAAAARPEVVRLDGVDVHLGGRLVLDRVSLSLGAGELVGLIGANGAGKTTLLRVILGQQRPSAGTVALGGDGRGGGPGPGSGGERLAPRNRRGPGGRGGRPARLARSVGYVPQRALLDPDVPLRARDLVALGLDGHRWGMPWPSARRAAAVDEALGWVGAGHLAGARVGELSGGEQQRVLVAHALVRRPRLLLLDEPLANLDIASGQEVVAVLDRVVREQGVTVLLSAHEMNPLLPVMDRIAYIARGRVASGVTDEVVRTDVLSDLYGHHVDVLHVHGRVLVVAGPGSGDEAAFAGGGARHDGHAGG